VQREQAQEQQPQVPPQQLLQQEVAQLPLAVQVWRVELLRLPAPQQHPVLYL
jgi:hypothetical protein